MPRLFIALELPSQARDLLATLDTGIAGARWVSPSQLHLTVRFLGTVSDERVEGLRQTLAQVSVPAFRVSLQGVGVFPPVPTRRKPARVLWAGLTPAGPIGALKAAVDAALGPDPETASREFSPHVTLARFKEPPPAQALADFLNRHHTLASPSFPVERFVLFESRTLPGGPVYSPVATYALNARG